MSRVFAVQQPTGRDRDTGKIRDTMDLSPAALFGEILFVLREWENPFSNIQATLEEIRRVLDVDQFGEDDYLLLVGNPILIGLVTSEAADRVDSLRMLQWNRNSGHYTPLSVQLD